MKKSRPPLHDPETFAIIGAAMEVHTELGPGFLEPVYRAALAIELRRRHIPFALELTLPIVYKGERLPVHYRVDYICYGAIIVEVKALHSIGPIEHAQAINYMRAARLQRALLLNFGGRSLEYRRLVYELPPEDDPRAERTAESPQQQKPALDPGEAP